MFRWIILHGDDMRKCACRWVIAASSALFQFSKTDAIFLYTALLMYQDSTIRIVPMERTILVPWGRFPMVEHPLARHVL